MTWYMILDIFLVENHFTYVWEVRDKERGHMVLHCPVPRNQHSWSFYYLVQGTYVLCTMATSSHPRSLGGSFVTAALAAWLCKELGVHQPAAISHHQRTSVGVLSLCLSLHCRTDCSLLPAHCSLPQPAAAHNFYLPGPCKCSLQVTPSSTSMCAMCYVPVGCKLETKTAHKP